MRDQGEVVEDLVVSPIQGLQPLFSIYRLAGMENMRLKLASWLGLLGVAFFVSATMLGGVLFPGYSHISQLISESYAIGTPYGQHLRFLGYLPSGLCIAGFAFFASRSITRSALSTIGFTGIGFFYGMATVIVSVFPCDEGCNKGLLNPSMSQLIHNLSGLLTYMFVPLSLVLLGITARKWVKGNSISIMGISCGLIAILFVGILFSDFHSGYAGLYQRIIEGAILTWITACSFYLHRLRKSRHTI